jgi:glycosyltransferase involved in cell wall biosynthesis
VKPEVSVIIPAYNRAKRLERAVRSVLEQGGVRFELLVVDDASEEPSEALYRELEELGHRVIRQERNSGPGPARNVGAKVARGEWLAFLDSDDHWLPGKLETHLSSLRSSGLRIGQAEEIWYRDGERVNPPKPHRIQGGDLFARSLKAVCVSSSTVMLKRELFWEHGGFDEELFVCEDYALWLSIAAQQEFEFCPEPLVVKYGGHDDQLSKALPAMDRFRILALLKGLHSGAFGEREEAAVKEVSRKLRILAKGSAKRGRVEAVDCCREIVEAVEESRYDRSVEHSRRLVGLWPTRP